jgi:hypothetical protein
MTGARGMSNITIKQTKIVRDYAIPIAEFKKLLGIGENEKIKKIYCDLWDDKNLAIIKIRTESEI